MANPVQATGQAATAPQTDGFSGWSPEDDRGRYTLQGAATPAQVKGAWTSGVALDKGDLVTNGGKRWRVKAAISGAANTVAPAENATFTDAEGPGRRGVGEVTTATAERPHLYR